MYGFGMVWGWFWDGLGVFSGRFRTDFEKSKIWRSRIEKLSFNGPEMTHIWWIFWYDFSYIFIDFSIFLLAPGLPSPARNSQRRFFAGFCPARNSQRRFLVIILYPWGLGWAPYRIHSPKKVPPGLPRIITKKLSRNGFLISQKSNRRHESA